MKKVILTFVCFVCISFLGFGQLQINSSGQVGIGCDPNTLAATFRVYSDNLPTFVLQSPTARLQIGVAQANGHFSSYSKANDIVYRPLAPHHGLLFHMPNVSNNGTSYIRFGDDANGGWFSIYNNRKVIIDGNVGIGRSPSYKLDVAGDIAINGAVRLSSDERLKTEIKSLSEEKNKLYLLQGKSYKKTLLSTGIMDVRYTEDGKEYLVEEKKGITEFSEYGYLAQELKEVFPNLVTQDSAGYYAVNYIALIPVIVEALKDQRLEIEKQQKQIEDLKRLGGTGSLFRSNEEIDDVMGISSETITGKATLYQNVPNPFNQSTEIKFYVPENAQSAQLCVYNLQGKQIKQITIVERGEGLQVISGSELTAGMYLYALIVDGKEIDTKRMILTE